MVHLQANTLFARSTTSTDRQTHKQNTSTVSTVYTYLQYSRIECMYVLIAGDWRVSLTLAVSRAFLCSAVSSALPAEEEEEEEEESSRLERGGGRLSRDAFFVPSLTSTM